MSEQDIYMEEIVNGIRDLIKISGMNPDKVNAENIDEIKERMKKDNLTVEAMSDKDYPLRTYVRLLFKDQVVSGWLVYLDLKLNIVKRVMIENHEQENQAIAFLLGQGDSFSLERDEE